VGKSNRPLSDARGDPVRIEDHTFVVTGGGSGLGAATARRLAGEGAAVVIADIQEDAARALVSDLGDRARFAATDVTDEAAMQAAIATATDTFGGLHGLINCAGVGPAMKVLGRKGTHPLDAFAKAVQINLVGTFNAIRLAAAAMVDNQPSSAGERGVIVNTASVAAFDGQIGQAAYAASKGGVVAMTLPIARELAEHGIRVMTIAPGIFDTPMLAALPENARVSLGQQVPFPPRLGKPEEYAALVAHIVSNEMLNGDVIRLDGAIRMAPR
jgi:NAD(P)-dependent dehydrogenase (short-subunit alcohol dehydrogenase family)